MYIIQCAYTCTYTCACIIQCACTYIAYTCTCTCTYKYSVHVHVHICICIIQCACTCIYIHMYMYSTYIIQCAFQSSLFTDCEPKIDQTPQICLGRIPQDPSYLQYDVQFSLTKLMTISVSLSLSYPKGLSLMIFMQKPLISLQSCYLDRYPVEIYHQILLLLY